MGVRDGMGRVVVGAVQDGEHIYIYPWLIQVNVWQKTPQYYKVISLQLEKKKKVGSRRAE